MSKPERRPRVAASVDRPIGKPAHLLQPVGIGNENKAPTLLPGRTNPSHIPDNNHAPKDTSSSVIGISASEIEDIKRSVLSLSPDLTDLDRRFSDTDPRIIDSLIADGIKAKDRPYEETQLRRILSQRSIANDYDEWDRRRNGGISGLDRRLTAMKEHNRFILVHTTNPRGFLVPRFGEKYLETIRKVLQAGTKLLYFERALAGRGFFPIIVFHYTRWINVKYPELKRLADGLQSQSLLKDTVEFWEDWSKRWVLKYEGQSSEIYPTVLTLK
ncbi:MAG: hypothetical protein Q9196_003344 [Gyalolechia fulgens]